MKDIVEKRVQIADDRAKQLEQLAGVRGMTESALVEEGLDLLFREHARQDTSADRLRADWELLQQWEAEFGSLEIRAPALKIDPNEIVSLVGTPVDPATVRQSGNHPSHA